MHSLPTPPSLVSPSAVGHTRQMHVSAPVCKGELELGHHLLQRIYALVQTARGLGGNLDGSARPKRCHPSGRRLNVLGQVHPTWLVLGCALRPEAREPDRPGVFGWERDTMSKPLPAQLSSSQRLIQGANDRAVSAFDTRGGAS